MCWCVLLPTADQREDQKHICCDAQSLALFAQVIPSPPPLSLSLFIKSALLSSLYLNRYFFVPFESALRESIKRVNSCYYCWPFSKSSNIKISKSFPPTRIAIFINFGSQLQFKMSGIISREVWSVNCYVLFVVRVPQFESRQEMADNIYTILFVYILVCAWTDTSVLFRPERDSHMFKREDTKTHKRRTYTKVHY